MCGRARLSSDVSEIKLAFRIPPDRSTPNIAPSWNVAPTDPLPVVRYDAKDRQRNLDVMRWGLVPLWAKDIKVDLRLRLPADRQRGRPRRPLSSVPDGLWRQGPSHARRQIAHRGPAYSRGGDQRDRE